MLPILLGISAGLQAYSSLTSSSAMKAQADMAKSQAKYNAVLNEMQQDQIKEQGLKDASNAGAELRQMLGSQKVAYAAQGVEVDSEIAQKVRDETTQTGLEDIATIKNNAWKQAWGLEMDKKSMLTTAQNNFDATNSQANATLITGGLKAINTGISAYKEGLNGSSSSNSSNQSSGMNANQIS